MSEFALKGPELKRMVKVARKQPLPFAFNPGKTDAEHYFALHRKRAASLLGKAAKKEGPGTKVSFGSCVVEQKVMKLTCERVIPAMAKSVKRFLKANKVMLNVVILDADGNVLEEDVEDMPDDPELAADDTGDTADTPEEAAAADPAPLIARIKAIQPRLAGVPEDPRQKLMAALQAVAADIKAQSLDPAAARLDQIEAVLERLLQAAAPQDGHSAKWDAAAARVEPAVAGALQVNPPQAARISEIWTLAQEHAAAGDYAAALKALPPLIKLLSEAKTPPSPAEDPRRKTWDTVADRLDPVVAATADAHPHAGDRLRAAWAQAVDAAAAQNYTQAMEIAKKLRDVMASLQAQAPAPAAEPAEAAPDDSGAADDWARALARLQPDADTVISGKLGDHGRVSAALALATERAGNGDYEGALQIVPNLEKWIAEALADGRSEMEQVIPDDVVPFHKAKLAWEATRKTLDDEMRTLQKAILDRIASLGLDDITSETEELFIQLRTLDGQVEGALENVIAAPKGEARDQQKSLARQAVDRLLKQLDTPFFQDVDTANGFRPVNVRAAAQTTLGQVRALL